MAHPYPRGGSVVLFRELFPGVRSRDVEPFVEGVFSVCLGGHSTGEAILPESNMSCRQQTDLGIVHKIGYAA